MMKPKYNEIAHLKNGDIICNSKFPKEEVVRFELQPFDKNGRKIEIVIDEDKELIFYKRIIKSLFTNKLENIIYFIGYSSGDSKYLLSLDSVTQNIRIEDDPLRQNRVCRTHCR